MSENVKQIKEVINIIERQLGFEPTSNGNKFNNLYAPDIYIDYDGNSHFIVENINTATENSSRLLKSSLEKILSVIYGTGEMCANRSRKFRSVRDNTFNIKKVDNKLAGVSSDITILTVASILILRLDLMCNDDMLYILSILTYWLDSVEV